MWQCHFNFFFSNNNNNNNNSHSLQTGVLTPPHIIALRIAAKPLQLAAWLLLTAYRNLPTPYATVPSPTPYGHLFSQNMGGDPSPKNAYCYAVRSVILATAGLLVFQSQHPPSAIDHLLSTFALSISSQRRRSLKLITAMRHCAIAHWLETHNFRRKWRHHS